MCQVRLGTLCTEIRMLLTIYQEKLGRAIPFFYVPVVRIEYPRHTRRRDSTTASVKVSRNLGYRYIPYGNSFVIEHFSEVVRSGCSFGFFFMLRSFISGIRGTRDDAKPRRPALKSPETIALTSDPRTTDFGRTVRTSDRTTRYRSAAQNWSVPRSYVTRAADEIGR